MIQKYTSSAIQTIGTLESVDPSKLNRGQVIHFESLESDLSDCTSTGCGEIETPNHVVLKNVVFCDWFESTICTNPAIEIDGSLAAIKLSEGVYLENRNNSTAHYNNVWNVIYMGELFGVLLTNPRQSYMNPSHGQFKIENEMLYRVDWLDTYKELLSVASWKHNNMTRFDICIDGEAGAKAKKIIHRHLHGYTVGRKGKAKMNICYSANKTITKYHVGSAASEKNATIYNKSEDIEKKGKDYITAAWNHNNLELSDNVERFELRMKSKVLKHYDWMQFDNPKYMGCIIRTECKNWFEFYYKGKDKNKHRLYKNNSMNWMNWKDIKGELLPKHQAVAKSGVHRAKRVVKDMLYLNQVENKRIDSRLIGELKNEYNLHKWYDSKIEYWIAEWSKESKYKNISSN